MQQVLFYLPFTNIPIYGYGTMLFVSFVFCTWLACWLARREGIDPTHIQDMAIWIFIVGIIGARLCYMFLAAPGVFNWGWPIVLQFFQVWDGGLVFYGSAVGGVVGYFLCYFLVLRKRRISTWKVMDIVAPCACLGLALGRMGCLLNGCCYGNVACADCPALAFPLSAPARERMVALGYQTAAGFTTLPRSPRVEAVEPGSAAERAGLKPGDTIVAVNELPVKDYLELGEAFGEKWPRGLNTLHLRVDRGGKVVELQYAHWSVPLYPTQVYESISMLLLSFLILALYPFKRKDGWMFVIFMLGYAVHRFLNEMLRIDTPPVALDMTLSQNISVLVLIAGLLLGLWIRLRPAASAAPPPVPTSY